ncbi:hypothetical protein KAJ99_09810, partial [Latilactobacillus sakei]|uniref:hypothetical protein n=1 Tax=Latilactobacillus sakei TaxID=1599 RepID=UPI001F34EA97
MDMVLFQKFSKLTMAASLTITFDENKYQLFLKENQTKRTYKRPASCRSITSLGNSQNTGSTSTPRTIVFGSLGPFPLPAEETAPAKKQKTASGRVAAPTPKATTKKPEARGNPTKPQPARNQVCSKTWSPRPSPKQRRSQKSAKPAYLAPLKENRFYPLAYMKEERPTLHQTKTTQHEPACSYKPKIKSCIVRPPQEPAKACTPAVRPFLSTGAELAKFKASLRQAKDRVQILSMPNFKEDRLGCCAPGTTSFIARAQPELTEAQIARRMRRRVAYRQKRLEKQKTQHSALQVSQKWVEKERPDQVAAVHMVGKTRRRQKSATKIHVRRPVTRSVSRTRRHQQDSPTPSSQGHRSNHSSSSSSKRMSSSSVTKTISSFDSRRVNVLVTNAEQPPPHDDVAARIQQLEQGQQRIEALMENLLLTLQRQPNNEAPPSHQGDEENAENSESRALTKKDVDDILAKAKEEDTLKE